MSDLQEAVDPQVDGQSELPVDPAIDGQPASYDELQQALKRLTPDGVDSALQLTLTPVLAKAILEHDPANRKLRAHKVTQYARIMTAGHWWPARSLPLMFFENGRLADGQHRCHAVVESGVSLPVRVIVATGTDGIDEGIVRSFSDHLALHTKTAKDHVALVSQVTRHLCPTKAPTNQELIDFFQEQGAFISECVQKPLAWLSEHEVEVARVLKPGLLATVRAKTIVEQHLPQAGVDDLLYDVVNAGIGGGPGCPAGQISLELHKAHQRARAYSVRDVVALVKTALEVPPGTKKNIITAARKRRKASARETE
jgi:hypothetical protein